MMFRYNIDVLKNMENILLDNIRYYLKSNHMKIAELELKAGLKPSAVHNILKEKSRNPSFETVTAIARTLGCSTEALTSQSLRVLKAKPKKTIKHALNPSLAKEAMDQLLVICKEQSVSDMFSEDFFQCF